MFTIRKDSGEIVKITLDELRGRKRESDGRFEVTLNDGSKGIMLREAEIAELEGKIDED